MFGISKTKLPPDATADAPADAALCDPFDEDNDGLGNVCDPCPADFNSGSDTDSDGVPDICDPDQLMPGDRKALFDGFDASTSAWHSVTGDWQRESGTFVTTSVGTARVELSLVAKTPSVEAILADYALGSDGAASVFGAMGGSELSCGVAMTPSGEVLRLHTFLGDKNMALPAGSGPTRIVGGQHRDFSFYCRARHAGNIDVEVQVPGFATQSIDTIGFITDKASVTASAVVVYDVP